MKNNPKYEALKLLNDETFSNKDSPSWKILSSVLYDFAKSLVVCCKNLTKDQIRTFVDYAVHQWWCNTPVLMRLDAAGHMLRLGNAHLRLKTYCRNRIRSRLSALLS